ncbi:MAG: SUMF1/EgtB/PvdO family nonheme iron enzyme, partial [Candidatus Binatia bacterium]
LFTGKHPFDRVPADKALAQGLEPEPVTFLKRRHWRALKRGLELEGDDRTPTIDEFMEGMFSEDPPILRYSIIGVVMAAIIGFSTYSIMFAPESNQELIQAQNKLELRKADLQDLLGSPKYTDEEWAKEVQSKLGDLYSTNETLVNDFSEPSDPALAENRKLVMDGFLAQIKALRENYSEIGNRADDEDNLKQASDLMARLKTYFPFDPDAIRSAELTLDTSIQLRDVERDRIEKERLAKEEAYKAEQERKAREKAAEEARQTQIAQYNTSANDLIELYKCKKGIDRDQMASDIRALQRIDPERFVKDRAGVVGGIVQCIDRTKVKDPDDAREIKKAGLALFADEPLIASITISALDPCAKPALVGTGARPRSQCKDDLTDGGTGPELVVIPETMGIKPFAVSRTEIKAGDYNAFCEATGCARLPGSPSMPATEISVEQARAYMAWLSDQSGRYYRLPTVEEWTYAAKTDKDGPVDPNVNCTVESRGVRLGESLVSALSGKPNRWGLYNEIGNAQEWATEG